MNSRADNSAGWRSALLLVAVITGFNLAGCAGMAAPVCGAGQEAAVSETLYFGTDMPGGEVSEEQWQVFIEEVVTPRFPQGLTHWPAHGQWRMATGEIIREGTFVLKLMHFSEAGRNEDVVAIMDSYKTQFQQEAVLRVQNPVCISL